MTKRIKLTFIMILSVLLMVCVGLFVFQSFTTYADIVDIPVENLDDSLNSKGEDGGNHAFSFHTGGAVLRNGAIHGSNLIENKTFVLGFQFNLVDPKHEHLINYTDDKVDDDILGDKLLNETFVYTFTVYREAGQGKAVPLEQIAIQCGYLGSPNNLSDLRMYKLVARKKLISSYSEGIAITNSYDKSIFEYPDDVDPYFNQDGTKRNVYLKDTKYLKTAHSFMESAENLGYEVLHYGEFASGGLFYPGNGAFGGDFSSDTAETTAVVEIKTESPFQNYFVKFDYQYTIKTKDNWFVTEYGTPESARGGCRSDIRKVSEVFKRLQDGGYLESGWSEGELSVINEVLREDSKKNVTVRYLEQVGDTPFAIKKEALVEIPVMNGDVIYPADVYVALGVDSLDCLNSQFARFDYLNDGVYEAYYYENVWLRTKTTDGHDLDYFLDINKSYAEYYRPFVDAGIMSQELYEYHFAGFHSKHDELEGYLPEDVFSYYGLAIIPDGFTFDRAWADMFGISPYKAGIINTFNYNDNLSYSSYMSLMEDYNYGWLDKVWSTVAGFADGGAYPAEYYVFYCDGVEREALIGEGGQDDPEDGGAIEEEIQDGASKIKNLFDWAFDKITTPGIILPIFGAVALGYIFIKFSSSASSGKKAPSKKPSSRRKRK